MKKSLSSCLLLSLVLVSGCGTPPSSNTKSQVGSRASDTSISNVTRGLSQDDARGRAATFKTTPSLPVGAVEIGAFKGSLYEYLVSSWISKGASEDEIFERAARAYGDVLQDYSMRVNSGLSPQEAKKAWMPTIRERIKSSSLPEGVQLAYEVSPTIFHKGDGISYEYDKTKQLLTTGSYSFVIQAPSTSKYKVVKKSASAGPVVGAWAKVWADSFKGETFNGRPTLGAVTAISPVVKPMQLPVSADKMYQLSKEANAQNKSFDDLLGMGFDGGYFLLGEPRCEEISGGTFPVTDLKCKFPNAVGSLAPIRFVTKSEPLPKS